MVIRSNKVLPSFLANHVLTALVSYSLVTQAVDNGEEEAWDPGLQLLFHLTSGIHMIMFVVALFNLSLCKLLVQTFANCHFTNSHVFHYQLGILTHASNHVDGTSSFSVQIFSAHHIFTHSLIIPEPCRTVLVPIYS